MRLVRAILTVLFLATTAHAQVSLWSSSNDADLTREANGRDFQIHDIVSVVVHVSADAVTEEELEVEKKDSSKLAIEQYIKLRQEGLDLAMVGYRPDDLGADLSSNIKLEDEGSNERTDTLNARLAAEIVDIKPNGNLVIEAKQQFSKQREKTTITLSGVVRPQDVSAGNVVYSYNVADADIRYESSGPITRANSRGWLGKIVGRLWLF